VRAVLHLGALFHRATVRLLTPAWRARLASEPELCWIRARMRGVVVALACSFICMAQGSRNSAIARTNRGG